ncbi:DUF2326 domain-containing protein [Neisseria musculi]|uniref:DUF2326 domain-containing protein n=1 Tax=Neisseria musculi TaxID=1815583 RepID=A0A7H1MBK9_9NEIS|nr:DUF2326 domain-containing protein [Neisseria musculi]QNT59024.1 hypothetical protein H7A79_0769 [Neisseria musculi]
MLKKLWSPTGLLLQDINFKPGLNLIIGSAKYGQSHGTNGIGKSSIVRLIDYLLLSSDAAKIFNSKKYAFLREQEHQVCLLLDNGDEFLQIRRSFGETKKVYIQENGQAEYPYEIEEAKKLFSGKFFPQTAERKYPEGSHRNLMNFFVKDDLTSVKRDDPVIYLQHGGAKKSLLILLNLYLLGLPSTHLNSLLETWTITEELTREANVLQKYLTDTSGKSVSQLRSEMAVKRKELELIRQSLSEFKLSDSFKRVSERIAELDEQLANLRKKERQTGNQLEKLKKFTESSRNEIDVDDVRKQYESVALDLGRIIRKSLEEVLDFRASITQERLKFYGSRMTELSSEHKKLLAEIQEKDAQRAGLMKTIDDNMDMSLTEAWGRYALESTKIAEIRQRLDSIEKIHAELGRMHHDESMHHMQMQVALSECSESVETIRSLFNEIVAAAFEDILYEAKGVYLDISAQGQLKNRKMPVRIEIGFPHIEALGQTKLKTVIYDLTVFLNAVRGNIPLPDFLIHDGVFHGIEIRKKVNLLNYIHERSEQSSFQYITTFNEDEIQIGDGDRSRGINYRFDLDGNIIINLKDKPEEMLFGFRF